MNPEVNALLLCAASNALETARWDEFDLAVELNIDGDLATQIVEAFDSIVPAAERRQSLRLAYWQTKLRGNL